MSRPKNPVCRAPHAAAGLREAQEVTKFSAPCDKILLQNTQLTLMKFVEEWEKDF
jgi:hypothetical protein